MLDSPGLTVGFCAGAVEESDVLVDRSVNYQFVTKFKITVTGLRFKPFCQ